MSIKSKNIILFQFNYLLIMFFQNLLIKQIKNECSRNAPILKDGICLLQYCQEEEFKEEICQINNEIIKTQWLNNIIKISGLNSRYVNYATYSNGDMIIATTKITSSVEERIFYGLKSNGRPFFNSLPNSETYFCSIQVNEPSSNYIAEIFVGIIDNKEKLFSIAQNNNYAEIYDFNNKEIENKMISELSSNQMNGLKGTILNYIHNDKNFIVFCFTQSNHIILKSLSYLSDSASSEVQISFDLDDDNYIGNSISCFSTSQQQIFCIYLCKNYGDSVYYGCIVVLKVNVHDVYDINKIKYINDNICIEQNSFLKSIYFKINIGVYIYYKQRGNDYINDIYPVILFEEYDGFLFHQKKQLKLVNY